MLQATLFLASLLLIVSHTFQVPNQLQRNSRKFYFDQRIVKPSVSRNLRSFDDVQGMTDEDWAGYQDQNGFVNRRRQGGRGREPQGKGASLNLNQLSGKSRADRFRSRTLGARNSALQKNIPSAPHAGCHRLEFQKSNNNSRFEVATSLHAGSKFMEMDFRRKSHARMSTHG